MTRADVVALLALVPYALLVVCVIVPLFVATLMSR